MRTRNGFRTNLACALGLLIALPATAPAEAEPATTPNIILMIADDAAWSRWSFMGDPIAQTPALDSLAEGGALFEVAYTVGSRCRPSAAGMITGRYCKDLVLDGGSVSAEQPVFVRALAEKGYATFVAGKLFPRNDSPAAFGFTEGDGFRNRGGRHRIEDNLEPVLDFIEREAEARQPFFIWFFPRVPHRPLGRAPREFYDLYEGMTEKKGDRQYFSMISWLDDMVGRIVASLNANSSAEYPLRDNTMIIFLSDNGGYLPHSKGQFTENSFRTPMIVNYPARIPSRRFVRKQIHGIDLFPTILDYAGVRMPRDPVLEGKSMRPLLEADPKEPEDSIFWREFLMGHACATFGRGGSARYLRTEYGYRFDLKKGASETARGTVYDVVADPEQTRRLDPGPLQQDMERWTRILNSWWTPPPSIERRRR